jgi:hypothetical protein
VSIFFHLNNWVGNWRARHALLALCFWAWPLENSLRYPYDLDGIGAIVRIVVFTSDD